MDRNQKYKSSGSGEKVFQMQNQKSMDVFYCNFDIVERSSKAAFCLYKGYSITCTNILWFQSDMIWIDEWMWEIRYSCEICFEMRRGGECKTEGHAGYLNPVYIEDIYLGHLFRIFSRDLLWNDKRRKMQNSWGAEHVL